MKINLFLGESVIKNRWKRAPGGKGPRAEGFRRARAEARRKQPEERRWQQSSCMCDVWVCLTVACAVCLSVLNGPSHLAEAGQQTPVTEKVKSKNEITQSL